MAKSRMKSSAAVVLFTALCATLSFSSKADACSCFVPPDPREALASSAAVFEGRVIAIAKKSQDGRTRLDVKLSVLKAWKGLSDEKTVTVRTNPDGAMCGYGFEKKASYLVYAVREGENLEASLCSRTKPLSEAQADIDAFKTDSKTADAKLSQPAAPPTGAAGTAKPQEVAPPQAPQPSTEAPTVAPASPVAPAANAAPSPPPSSVPPAGKSTEPSDSPPPASRSMCSSSADAGQSDGGWWFFALAGWAVCRRRVHHA